MPVLTAAPEPDEYDDTERGDMEAEFDSLAKTAPTTDQILLEMTSWFMKGIIK